MSLLRIISAASLKAKYGSLHMSFRTSAPLRTSADAYTIGGETGSRPLCVSSLRTDTDEGGTQTEQRVVVFGSGLVYGDDLLGEEKLANSELLVQTISWLDGDEDIDENAEPDDEQRPDDPGTDVNDDWYEDDELESDEKASPESYIIDGHEYKDPRKYIQALYQQDVRQYPKLEPEEQIELACAVRWGMLCDCSIMPEDPVVPDEYPYDEPAYYKLNAVW